MFSAAAVKALHGLTIPKIKDVQVIATAPQGSRLTVVKIVTDQDGLYGYGCATFTQRADLVVVAVEKYLKPFLVGKPADRIDDTWQACYNSSYWRNGPVLNNAISGVDQALWDIKGRQAGMPVYQLLGGKMREAAASYTSVGGGEVAVDDARTRLCQQRLNGLAPAVVMRGLLVFGGVVRGAVDLDEEEAGRVVGLLEEIEAGNTGLLNAGTGIGLTGLLELLQLVCFDMDEDMDDMHGTLLCAAGAALPL